MELWNLKNLEAPPITSSELRGKEINLRMLHNVLTEGISFFENQQHLCLEATVLSRLIYRMKMKFRSSKDFKILEKLNHSLLNYLQIDISKILTTFHLLVPQQCTSNETYLPSKNMLHYVLVRLQGLGKLFWSILETCKIASRMQQQRMRLGHFWRIAIIVFGIVSRIFIITKNMIKFTCELYSNLELFLKKLTNPGPRWLPNNYIVPQSLTDWLQIDWLDLDTTVIIEIPDEEPNIISYFNLIDSDDDDDNDILISDEYIIVNDDPSIASSDDDVIYEGKVEEDKNNLQGFQDDDVGEIVDLEAPSPPRKKKLLNRANFFKENSDSNNDSVVFVGEIVADNSDNGGIVKVAPNSIENKSLKRKKLPHNNRSDVKDVKMSKAKKRKLQNENLPLDSSVNFKNETVSKRKKRKIKKKIVTLGYSASVQEVTPKGKKIKVKKKNVTLESPGTVKNSARKKKKFNRNSLVVNQDDDASGTGTKKSRKKKKKKVTENRVENLKLTFKQKRKNRKRKSKGMVFKTQNRADFTT